MNRFIKSLVPTNNYIYVYCKLMFLCIGNIFFFIYLVIYYDFLIYYKKYFFINILLLIVLCKIFFNSIYFLFKYIGTFY